MINFLFGLFQSLNGVRYTLWVLWRLKVNIWFCLPSLQFTDKYQVLCFSCRLPEIKVSIPGKKRVRVGGNRPTFPKNILCYPVAEINFDFSFEKEKTGCCTPCGPQMFFFFLSHCPNTQRAKNSPLRHLAKVKNTVDKVRIRPQESSLHIEFVQIRQKEWELLSRVSPFKVRGGQYHTLHRKMHGKHELNYCCCLFWIYHTVRLS